MDRFKPFSPFHPSQFSPRQRPCRAFKMAPPAILCCPILGWQNLSRGAQDDKCIGMQYLEAIKKLKEASFQPLRTVHISYVPDEEIGGFDGAKKFAESREFRDLNVGFMLDEGQASVNDEFRVFYADRSPWHLVIKAEGKPGHGSSLYDNSAFENLMKSIEVMSRYRESQFDLLKAGLAANGEVVSVNPVYLKAGNPTPVGFVKNVKPSEAEAGFDLRLPPTADPDLLRRRIANEWAPATRNMTYQVRVKPLIKASSSLSSETGVTLWCTVFQNHIPSTYLRGISSNNWHSSKEKSKQKQSSLSKINKKQLNCNWCLNNQD
ncbi:N-acyl-aliphatic-L-amino acid amidohydrolase [Ranunculus cassubicifolius]